MLTGRIGLSPIMIGRNAALDRLRSVFEMAELHSSDLPTVALIAGEAGIGKTRLLREMLAILPRDVTVFSAMAEPRSLGRAFDVAAQLVPVLSPDEDPADAAMAAINAITAAARVGRVALVIEDLHWIDADSVNVIDAVARQPLPNLVIFGTYRPADLNRGAPGGDLVLRLERRNEVDQFRLDRLDRSEVGALMSAIAGRPASSAAIEAVSRRSGGVPFVVEELMRFAGPEACSEDIVGAQLPWSLEEAVRQQLAGLNPNERSIVEVLAVFGQPATFEALTAVTGFDERELLVHLRALVGQGVVEEIRNDRLWFGHALLAESVTQQLLGRERRRLHETCFDTIAKLAPDDYAALAYHADGAGRYDEIVAIARTGSRMYLDRGASFQALRLACEGLAEDPDDPSLLGVATEAAWRLDFLQEALGHGTNWIRVAPIAAQRVDAMRLVARINVELNHHDVADEMVGEMIEFAGSLGDGADRARAEAAVAQLMMLRGDERATVWAERAIAQAEAAGDKQVLVQARLEWASSQSQQASLAEALAALRDAAEDARVFGDGVLLSRALNNTLDLLPPHGDESRRLRDELRSTALASGLDKMGHLDVIWWEAIAAHAVGDLAAYRRLLDEWASWKPAPTRYLRYATESAALAAEEGRVADGRAILDGDNRLLETCWRADVNLQWVVLAAVGRDPVDGRVGFENLLGSESIDDNWFAPGMVLQTVASAIELGIPTDEIRTRFLGTYLAGHPAHERLTRAAEGLLLLADGDHDAAADSLRQTLKTARESVARPIEGSLRLAYAQALLARGDRSGALYEAREAVESLAKWPGWRRDRAEAMLGRLEGTAVRPVGDLTARESEVASLIAEGLTNAQLAERLFISPKTAAVHVSNILAKLGLSSRTEIAAWSIRRGMPAGF